MAAGKCKITATTFAWLIMIVFLLPRGTEMMSPQNTSFKHAGLDRSTSFHKLFIDATEGLNFRMHCLFPTSFKGLTSITFRHKWRNHTPNTWTFIETHWNSICAVVYSNWYHCFKIIILLKQLCSVMKWNPYFFWLLLRPLFFNLTEFSTK